MRENFDDKSLVKVTNNIFFKIRNWFVNLFRFKTNRIENTINVTNTNIDVSKSNTKQEFLNSLKTLENDDTNIFNLQRKYENGLLKVSDMSEDEYSKIEDLYNRQIENITNQIKIKKAKLSTN